MQLEDHCGDIIRKARALGGVSTAAAAAAAGISESALATLEAAGTVPNKINFPELAKTIGLHPQKLAAIASGWLPSPKKLSGWRELRMFTTKNDELSVNCYLIWDPATRAAALFDTGLDALPILETIAAGGVVLKHIFITHSHWDHVEALPAIRAAFPDAQLHSGSPNAPVRQRNRPDEIVRLGELSLAHRATPGHAVDGVTYLVSNWSPSAPTVAFVGDAIFAGSIGRGNQSWDVARQKVREEILSLPLDTLICPGHGPMTTVAEEVKSNPFF